MNITGIIKPFIEANAEDDLRSLILNAFDTGYKVGRYEAAGSWNTSKIRLDINFIDLDLPSGTLWGLTFLWQEDYHFVKMNFKEAQQFRLPTKKQCEELIRHCELKAMSIHLTIKGKNENRIYLENADFGHNISNVVNIKFWTDDKVDSDGRVWCMNFEITKDEPKPTITFEKVPVWHRLPVAVIKR